MTMLICKLCKFNGLGHGTVSDGRPFDLNCIEGRVPVPESVCVGSRPNVPFELNDVGGPPGEMPRNSPIPPDHHRDKL